MDFLAGFILGTATALLACGAAVRIYLRTLPPGMTIESTYRGAAGAVFHLVREDGSAAAADD